MRSIQSALPVRSGHSFERRSNNHVFAEPYLFIDVKIMSRPAATKPVGRVAIAIARSQAWRKCIGYHVPEVVRRARYRGWRMSILPIRRKTAAAWHLLAKSQLMRWKLAVPALNEMIAAAVPP
jgi:hypothetical protein